MNDPISREEMFLAKAAGDYAATLSPITREEMFLAKAAGEDINLPKPITRKEMYLEKIASSANSDEPEIYDGKTRLYISIENDERKKVSLEILYYSLIDWGDGSEPGTSSTHEYDAKGDYVITIEGAFTINPTNTSYYSYGYGLLKYRSSNLRFAPPAILKKVVLGNGITLNQGSFDGCVSMKKIIIPAGTKISGGGIFRGCSTLENVVIPSGVTSISNDMFADCSGLRKFSIPDTVTTIKSNAFDGCKSLLEITIPSGISNFGSYAFRSCESLTKIKIPSTVTNIGKSCFNSCHYMKYYDFTSHESIPTLASASVFGDNVPDWEIRVPASLYDEWIAATNWSSVADMIVAVEV